MTFPVFSCPLNMQTVGMESFDFSALLHAQAVLGPVEQNYPGNTQDFRLLQLRFNGENAAKFIHSKNNIFRQSKK